MAQFDWRIPLFETLKNYKKSWIKADLWAGLTVGTILVPQAMAYALLAGVEPIYGLYASLVPLVLYAIFASSTKLSIGPVAVSALLVLAGVSELAQPGTEEYLQLVIITGLLVGVFQILLAALRLGFIVNFISHPVIAGFTSAAAIIIVTTQLKDAFGIASPSFSNSLDQVLYIFQNLDQTNFLSLIFCVLSFILIFTLRKINRTIPGALIAVILGTALCYGFGLHESGLSIIRDIPSGLPSFTMLNLEWDQINRLIPTVATVTLIGVVESVGIAKALESKYKDHTVRANQELFALGISKMVGSFFQSIPSSGSFSRSAINSDSGAKTPLSGIIAALLVALSVVFLTSFFYYLPRPVLAAIIIISVIGLFDLKEAIHLWRTHRMDLFMMITTFVATLLLGIMEGVLCGVILSIVNVLYRSTKPNFVVLGNIPSTPYYKNLARYESAEALDDSLILRFDDQLYFGNASYFKETIYKMIKAYDGKLKFVILDGSNIHDIDSSGIHVLKDLDQDLKNQDIELHLSGAIGIVRDRLYKADLLKEENKHHLTIQDAVSHIQKMDSEAMICRSANPLQTNIKKKSK